MTNPTTSNGNAPMLTRPLDDFVAVVGMGCVMPDANNVAEFWRNIVAGRDSITEVPTDRWDPALFWDPDPSKPDKTYSKIGAFVKDFKFNAVQFRIPPSVSKSLDDTQKWAIAAVQEALVDAGYDKKPFDRTRTAVIFGNAMGGEVRNHTGLRVQFPKIAQGLAESPAFRNLPPQDQDRIMKETETAFKRGLPEINEDTMPGELSNVIAGRVANLFDFSGKNFTTDAACASSLAAIDAAVHGLLSGDYDLVFTGGADRSMDVATYVKFCKIGALSAKGSFPFDARADGFVMGEGCGVLVLKRLGDAIRDGDKIRAVIRGVGSSSDAKGKGITAPNIDGQLACLNRALRSADIEPETLSLLECHGTSTKVGDVIEVQALTRIFGPRIPKKQSIPIGSIKSQVGHLKSAAGAASLIKVILALENKTLPPSIHFETPNPSVRFSETPFYVNTKAAPWPEPAPGTPRRVAVSSFGFGGTNFNVVLEEYAPGVTKPKPRAQAVVAAAPKPATPVSDVLLRRETRHRNLEPLAKNATTEVLVLGGASASDVTEAVRDVEQRLASGRLSPRNFPNFAFEKNRHAANQAVRVALVVESLSELPERLTLALDGLRDPKKRPILAAKGIYVGEGPRRGKLAMLFPGQGSQYVDMVRDLSTRFESVKRTLEEIDEVMIPFLGKRITEYVFLDAEKGVGKEAAEEALKRTEITQPAMLVADLAIYRLLSDYGIRPDMVAGHSLGEYGALVAAGVLTLEDACIAVSARGREMANIRLPDLGKMASVTADPTTVEQMLKQVAGYVIPANKNCRVQTVIAGSSPSVDAAVKMFNAAGIQAQHIPVSAAFHSEIVAPASVPLMRVLEGLDVREPKLPISSNVTADYYPNGAGAREKIVQLLGQQVKAPVEWQKQLERMHADGARVFVEVGPKATLTTFVKNTLEGKEYHAVATNHPKKGGFFHFFDALAFLAAWGYPVRFPEPTSPTVSLQAYRDAVDPAPATEGDARGKLIENLTAQLEDLRGQVERLRAGGGVPSSAAGRDIERLGLNLDAVVISGASVGLPGSHKRIFDDENFERVLRGENLIEPVPMASQRAMLDKNIVRLVKSDKGDHRFESIRDVSEVIRLAGQPGSFDLEKDYGVNEDFVDALDRTSMLAIAAGIEALKDAGIPLVRGFVKTSTGKFLPGEWVLPEPLQGETGIVFASAFPGINRLIEAISDYFASKNAGRSLDELADVYAELIQKVRDPEVRRRVTEWYTRHFQTAHGGGSREGVYEFNRKFLFHVLSMGHAQVAQLIKAKGPNTQVNAACSSTTQAVAIAEDWIRTGRCKRVLVVGADDITSPGSLDWFASGFLAAGAATTKDDVREAALPFDRRRHGMILGMGAVGLVVEASSLVKERGMDPIVEVIASHIANSAYHGSRLDTDHVATEMDRLLGTVEKRLGRSRAEIAPKLLFMSHETYTPARGGSAAAEIEALRRTFGASANKVLVSNTKGFTGHPMGASIEDAIAIKSLQRGRAPPIANLREPDPALGDLNLSQGGPHNMEYALRLAAGFGSQIAFLFFQLRSRDEKRIVDSAAYQAWLRRMSGNPRPELEVVNRALRIKSTMTQPLMEERAAPPTVVPSPSVAPPPPAPAPVRPISPTPVPVASRDEIQRRVVALIADKTGYPTDMLDPALDLEADLGIDTVKQAELFGFVRETYDLPREDTLQLKDYPTIARITDYIVSRLAGTTPSVAAAPPPAPSAPPAPALTAPAPATPARAASPDLQAEVQARLLDLVAEKTGYPKDMLDVNLDLEADLGIDTVKQAEVFGHIRDQYQLVRDESLQLKDYPTLARITEYIVGRLTGTTAAPASSAPPATLVPPSARTVAEPSPVQPPSLDRSEVQRRVVALIAEKTGYPTDMLEPELDLEADLGIDTVKQAELFGMMRETYHLPRDESLQLKDYPTISKIAGYLHGRLIGQTPAAPPAAPSPEPLPPPVPSAPPSPPIPQAASAAPTGDRAAVIAAIRSLISEKTGYPPELLEEDLDLEADLGIDTVKQAEIFGFVRERFNIPRVENLQLSEYSTLGRVADFALQNAGQTAPKPPIPEAAAPTPSAAPLTLPKRLVVHYAPIPAAEPSGSLSGKTLLVWAAPSLRADLVHELRRREANPVALDGVPQTWEEAKSHVETVRRSHPKLNGLVFVPTPNPTGTEFEPEQTHDAKALFWLLKAVLSTGKSGEFDSFATATFLGGDFGMQAASSLNPLEGALAGIAKSLRRELPNATSKVVDFPLGASAPSVASKLVEELLSRDAWVEVGTLGGRGSLKLSEERLSEEEPGLDLSGSDVLVLSGGGSGITSDIALALARRTKTQLVLLGRTAIPGNVAELAQKSPQELAALRTRIADDLKARGERATPVQVEREFSKIQKAVETHRLLEGARAAGTQALYFACDVTDEKAVARVLAEARRSLGPITGIIHAAGLEESKLLVDKTPDSFNRVFDVKVIGARNLLEATREDPLRLWINFSSVAGRFGNAGQADYSAANDVLAKTGLALRRERGRDFAAVTIDWSAWAEKGMATRGSTMTVLNEAGVVPIPLAAGVESFLQEIAHGLRDPEIVVAGEMGRLADARLFGDRPAGGPAPSPRPSEVKVAGRKTVPSPGQTSLVLEPPSGAVEDALLDAVVSQDERTVVAKIILDPQRDPYLKDHAVDGVPYLPGVFGIEAFAEAASRLAPQRRFVGARDVEFHLPVKVLRNQPLEVSVHASIANADDASTEVGCRLQSIFVNAKGERLGAPRIHFTGTLLFEKDSTAPHERPAPRAQAETLSSDRIYQLYFHGPSFRVLDSLQLDRASEAVSGDYAWPDAPLFGRERGDFLTDPLVRELGFQTAGGYDLFALGHLALPKAVRRLRHYAPARVGEVVRATATYRGTRDQISHYNVHVTGENGRLLQELEDFELIRIRPLSAAPPAEGTNVYRARWGRDFPVPLTGAHAVLVRQSELKDPPVRPEEALTAGERADQERYRNERRAAEFFAGRLAAKEAIAQLVERSLKEARGIEIRRLETGEPAARGKGLENVLVSITHTGDVALSVAARRDALRSIGIDAERIEEKPHSFETEAFSPEEQKILERGLKDGRSRGEMQVLLWAVKEAVLKALGKGFALDLLDVRIQGFEPDGRARVRLEEPARKCLTDLGAASLFVQTWIQDGHVYALSWTTAA